VLLQENPSAEHLLDLAGRLDCLLRLHRRQPAVAHAEALLETLGDHHRALHQSGPWCDDGVIEHVDDLAVTLIAEVTVILGELRQGDRWPDAELRREVAAFAGAELATVTGIALTPRGVPIKLALHSPVAAERQGRHCPAARGE
jgi:hypothetical protein